MELLIQRYCCWSKLIRSISLARPWPRMLMEATVFFFQFLLGTSDWGSIAKMFFRKRSGYKRIQRMMKENVGKLISLVAKHEDSTTKRATTNRRTRRMFWLGQPVSVESILDLWGDFGSDAMQNRHNNQIKFRSGLDEKNLADEILVKSLYIKISDPLTWVTARNFHLTV